MNVLEAIERDHGLQRDLMGSLKRKGGDPAGKKRLFEQFATEFRAHAAAEEHAFYAELMKDQASTDQSRHSVQEHAEAIELLEKLEKMDMDAPDWAETFEKLAHDNEHHMEEEEKEVFPLARDVLGKERLTALGKVFETRKGEEM